MMRLGKHKNETEEKIVLTSGGFSEYGSLLPVGSTGDILLNIEDMQISPNMTDGLTPQLDAPYSITTPVCVDKLKDKDAIPLSLKPQDFQVNLYTLHIKVFRKYKSIASNAVLSSIIPLFLKFNLNIILHQGIIKNTVFQEIIY